MYILSLPWSVLIKPVSDIIIFYLKILTEIDNLFNLLTRTETENWNTEIQIFPNNGHQAITSYLNLKIWNIFINSILRIIENQNSREYVRNITILVFAFYAEWGECNQL